MIFNPGVRFSSMDRDSFICRMEELAPPALAEEFDAGRIGLVVEGTAEIGRVCCALDATEAVVEQAVSRGADMLVVHHTPIWTPVTQVTGWTADLLRQVLSANMNLYVMHTNFDRATGGVNDSLAELLGLTEIQPMDPGLIGNCTITVEEISRRLGGHLRIWGGMPKNDQLALVAGSGFDPAFIAKAATLGAGAFLSAELKHSLARHTLIPCLESTHYALEAPAMDLLSRRMGWVYIDDPPELQHIR